MGRWGRGIGSGAKEKDVGRGDRTMQWGDGPMGGWDKAEDGAMKGCGAIGRWDDGAIYGARAGCVVEAMGRWDKAEDGAMGRWDDGIRARVGRWGDGVMAMGR